VAVDLPRPAGCSISLDHSQGTKPVFMEATAIYPPADTSSRSASRPVTQACSGCRRYGHCPCMTPNPTPT
jgi:hypothetical protein